MSFIEAKRISETSSVLIAVRNCLMEKMVYSLKYPDYSYPLTSEMCEEGTYSSHKAVDKCLCGRYTDAWGRRIRYLDGFDDSNSSLEGKYVISKPWAGISSTGPSTESSIIDKNGEKKERVAFVLISFGKNGEPDDSSYGNLLSDHNLVGELKEGLPKFNSTDTGEKDDIYLFVTGDQIRAFLKR